MNKETTASFLRGDLAQLSFDLGRAYERGEAGSDSYTELYEKRYLAWTRLRDAMCEDKWIPIKEPPKPYKEYLAWLPDDPFSKVQKGYFEHFAGRDRFNGDNHYPLSEGKVTHYRLPPEGPREKD